MMLMEISFLGQRGNKHVFDAVEMTRRGNSINNNNNNNY